MYNLGLIGRAYSGKSSIARVFEDEFHYTRLSFATPIKKITKYFGDDGKSKGKWRKTYIELSLLLKRSFGDDIFLKGMERQMMSVPGKIVVDDVRYPYEAEFLLERGFLLVYVETPKDILIQRMLDAGEDVDFLLEEEAYIDNLKDTLPIFMEVSGLRVPFTVAYDIWFAMLRKSRQELGVE